MSDPTADAQATARDVLAGHLARYGGCECGAEQPEWAPSDQWWRRHYVDVLAAAGCLAPAAPPTDDALVEEVAALDRQIAYLESLEDDRRQADADAEQSTAGMREVAQMRSINAMCLQGAQALRLAHRLREALVTCTGVVALRERAAALDRVLDVVERGEAAVRRPASDPGFSGGAVFAAIRAAAQSAALTEEAGRG